MAGSEGRAGVPLFWRRVLGHHERREHFNESFCLRCLRPWSRVEARRVAYKFDGSRAMFALCKECWAQLTPGDRLPYYLELAQAWMRESYADESGYGGVSWQRLFAVLSANILASAGGGEAKGDDS